MATAPTLPLAPYSCSNEVEMYGSKQVVALIKLLRLLVVSPQPIKLELDVYANSQFHLSFRNAISFLILVWVSIQN